MARKTEKGLSRWLTATPERKEKRFVMVGNSLFFNKKFCALSVGARFLYILAANESAGKREFQLPATKIEALGIPVRTARNYLKELEAAGFIELVRSGKTTRTANDYQFCFRWLDDG